MRYNATDHNVSPPRNISMDTFITRGATRPRGLRSVTQSQGKRPIERPNRIIAKPSRFNDAASPSAVRAAASATTISPRRADNDPFRPRRALLDITPSPNREESRNRSI